MAGKDVREKCAAEHDENAGKKTKDSAETSLSHPEKNECANGENMECLRPGNRKRHRQNQKEPIGRVELGSLHPSEIRRSAEDMRVPECKISFCQLPESEFPPREILQEQVTARISRHTSSAGKQKIGKRRKRQNQQQDECANGGTMPVH